LEPYIRVGRGFLSKLGRFTKFSYSGEEVGNQGKPFHPTWGIRPRKVLNCHPPKGPGGNLGKTGALTQKRVGAQLPSWVGTNSLGRLHTLHGCMHKPYFRALTTVAQDNPADGYCSQLLKTFLGAPQKQFPFNGVFPKQFPARTNTFCVYMGPKRGEKHSAWGNFPKGTLLYWTPRKIRFLKRDSSLS